MGLIKQQIEIHYCDFCGKSEHEVEVVVCGPRGPRNVCICNECVAEAVKAVSEFRKGKAQPATEVAQGVTHV